MVSWQSASQQLAIIVAAAIGYTLSQAGRYWRPRNSWRAAGTSRQAKFSDPSRPIGAWYWAA